MHLLPFMNFKRLFKNILLYGKEVLQNILQFVIICLFVMKYWEDYKVVFIYIFTYSSPVLTNLNCSKSLLEIISHKVDSIIA